MGSFEPSVKGGGEHEPSPSPHHNVVVIDPMKFGTGVKLDLFYTIVTKMFVTSLLLRNNDIITCILVDT